MNTSIKLMKEIMGMKFPWNIWMVFLILVNLAGFIFITTREGQFVIIAMISAFFIMLAIYLKKGFVKLLGLGHIIAWVPLLIFLILTLIEGNVEGVFKVWLMMVVVLNGVSLIIDIIDVVKYFSKTN